MVASSAEGIGYNTGTQTTVALSSGEAELGGSCRGASKALGLQAQARDLGLEFKLDGLTDSTAATRICRRADGAGLDRSATLRWRNSGSKSVYDPEISC